MDLGAWWMWPSSIRCTTGVVVCAGADLVVFLSAGFTAAAGAAAAAACFVVLVGAGLAAAAVEDAAGRASRVAVCAAGAAAGTASVSHLHMLAGQLLSAQEEAHHALNDTALML